MYTINLKYLYDEQISNYISCLLKVRCWESLKILLNFLQ